MTFKNNFNVIIPKLGKIIQPIFGGMGHIFMFHRVCPLKDALRISANAGMEVTPDHLEKIIHFFITRDYTFLSPDQLEDWLARKSRKEKFAIFTFDDGYADNLHYAYPIFKKHNIPFTIYIATHFPERTAILWWYLLEDIIVACDQLEIEVDKNRYSFLCHSDQEKEETFSSIRSLILRNSTRDRTLPILKEIFFPFQIDLYKKTDELTLSWDHIKRLNSDPLVTIGAHTVNHFVLSKLSQEEAKEEIMESKRKIESHLNEKIHHFAFPFGGESDAGIREFKMIKECGFKTAVTTRFTNVYRKHKNHLECLPRIFITPESDTEFLKQVDMGTATLIKNRFRRIISG